MAQRGHKCPDFVGGPILPVWSLRSREPVPATKRQPTLDIFAGGDVASRPNRTAEESGSTLSGFTAQVTRRGSDG
jgi:hypothetical protein